MNIFRKQKRNIFNRTSVKAFLKGVITEIIGVAM